MNRILGKILRLHCESRLVTDNCASGASFPIRVSIVILPSSALAICAIPGHDQATGPILVPVPRLVSKILCMPL